MKGIFFKKNIEFQLKYYQWIILVSTLVTVLSIYVVKEKFSIKSKLADLLPEHARSVKNYYIVRKRVGSPEYVQAIIKTSETEGHFLEIITDTDAERHEIAYFFTIFNGKCTDLYLKFRKNFSKDFDNIENEKLNKVFTFIRLTETEFTFYPSKFYKYSEDLYKIPCIETVSFDIEDYIYNELRGGDPNRDGVYEFDFAKKYAKKIADALEELPEIDYVFYRLDINFIKRNALLFVSKDKLIKLKCCIEKKQKEKIKEEFSLSKGDSNQTDEEEEDEEDEFGYEEKPVDPECKPYFEGKLGCNLSSEEKSTGESYTNMVPEYFVSKMGFFSFFIHPILPSTELEFNKRVQKLIRKTIKQTIKDNPKTLGKVFLPDTLDIGGGYRNRLEEVKRIKSDLASSAGVTLFLLILVLFLYFRKIAAVPIVLIPLIFGISYTMAIVFLTIGYLNLITAFIFAILFGLGIDLGIHKLSRYMEERTSGRSVKESLIIIQEQTGSATITASVTTAATFFSLMFTSFKGFTQFGFIAGIGLLLCVFVVFFVFPSFVILSEKISDKSFIKAKSLFIKNKDKKWTMPVVMAVIILLFLTNVSIGGLWSLEHVKFEYNFNNLKSINPKISEVDRKKSGSTTGLTLSPVVMLAETQEEAKGALKKMRRLMKETKKLSSIDRVIGLWDLIPENQDEKLKIIKDIHELLKKKRDFVDNERVKKLIEKLYEYTNVKKITIKTIPDDIKIFFREKPEPLSSYLAYLSPKMITDAVKNFFKNLDKRKIGRFIFIFPLKDMWDGRAAIEFDDQISQFEYKGKKLPVSGSALIMADIIHIINIDGPRAITISLIVVFLILLFDIGKFLGGKIKRLFILTSVFVVISVLYSVFYHYSVKSLIITFFTFLPLAFLIDRKTLPATFYVMFPLISSFLIIFFVMYVFDMKLNFYNMVVLPAIIGIGIDNSVHLFHRYKEEGEGSTFKVIHTTGFAIFLSSLTTLIGFAGMLFTNHLGLRSIGKLALIGISLPFLTSIIFMPATWAIYERLRKKQ